MTISMLRFFVTIVNKQYCRRLVMSLVIAASMFSYCANAFAKQEIVAVVNSHVITEFDLQKRVNLLLKTTGLTYEDKTINILKLQALQMLVDERLFEGEAKRFNIKIDPADMSAAKGKVASNHHMTLSQFQEFIKKAGISEQEVETQLYYQLVWHKILKSQIEPTVAISKKELEQLKSMTEQYGAGNNVEVKLAEILLVADKSKMKDLESFADDLYNRIHAGADFSKIAKEFSKGNTADTGGEIGWFNLGQLSYEFGQVLEKLEVGEVSTPIVQNESIHIMKVLETKKVSESSGDDRQQEQFVEMLRQQKMDAKIKSYLIKLRKDAYINFLK